MLTGDKLLADQTHHSGPRRHDSLVKGTGVGTVLVAVGPSEFPPAARLARRSSMQTKACKQTLGTNRCCLYERRPHIQALSKLRAITTRWICEVPS